MNNFSSKGFFYEKKFLNNDFLKKTQSFFDSHIEIESTNTTTKKFNYIDLDQFAILESLHKEILKYVKKNIKINCVLRNIWMQKSFYSIENKGLPYIPHIDKKRYFKIFLYLNDIEINNGPFTVSTNSSVKENEKLRKNWWRKNDFNQFDTTIEKEHGLLVNEKNLFFKPMCLPAGSIIGFDSNCPHYGGNVKEGFYRNVLRFNYFALFDNNFNLSFMKEKLFLNLKKFKNNYFKN